MHPTPFKGSAGQIISHFWEVSESRQKTTNSSDPHPHTSPHSPVPWVSVSASCSHMSEAHLGRWGKDEGLGRAATGIPGLGVGVLCGTALNQGAWQAWLHPQALPSAGALAVRGQWLGSRLATHRLPSTCEGPAGPNLSWSCKNHSGTRFHHSSFMAFTTIDMTQHVVGTSSWLLGTVLGRRRSTRSSRKALFLILQNRGERRGSKGCGTSEPESSPPV